MVFISSAKSFDSERQCLYAAEYEAFAQEAEMLEIGESEAKELISGNATKFESREGFNIIRICCPHKNITAGIYFRKNLLAFAANSKETLGFIRKTAETCGAQALPDEVLCSFLMNLTAEDAVNLDNIEQEITELEVALISSDKTNCLKEIITLRHKLLAYKRYYERLMTVCEDLETNENGLIEKKKLRLFRILTKHVERRFQDCVNLRDYVTQVREAYQSQVDIDLNNIMKVFTVITAVFLPLTLIAGWYGMNFNMPEYGFKHAYAAVIAVSVLVVVMTVIYFKRKKWF